jgi:CRISPR-associated protein Csd2
MGSLTNKIDFAVVLSVKNANPNGDPLNGNRPRVNYDGTGEITDVCIKRKIRNRLMDAGYDIFVQSDDNKKDNCKNLLERFKTLGDSIKDDKKLREDACKKWIDVRAFGQVFPFKGESKKKGKSKDTEGETDSKGVSIGIRGPVSLHPAFSIVSVNANITSNQITKSTSLEGDGKTRQSDQMGMQHRVNHGLYMFYGSMNPQLATKTGFSDADAQAIKQALLHLFENDASSARPEGSMEIVKLFWWAHNCPSGQYPSAKVHRSLQVIPNVAEPNSIKNYDIETEDLAGLTTEVIDGF